jgi:hypothetical protein
LLYISNLGSTDFEAVSSQAGRHTSRSDHTRSKMLFTSTLLFSLAATVLARPQDVAPAAAGSKKNIYLATCTSRSVITSTSPQSDIPIQLLTHQATPLPPQSTTTVPPLQAPPPLTSVSFPNLRVGGKARLDEQHSTAQSSRAALPMVRIVCRRVR